MGSLRRGLFVLSAVMMTGVAAFTATSLKSFWSSFCFITTSTIAAYITCSFIYRSGRFLFANLQSHAELRRKLHKRYGQKGEPVWAIITGASDGIGAEFARQLSQLDINIVLVARNRSKLTAVQKTLSPNVSSHVVIADFAKETPSELYPRLEKVLFDDLKLEKKVSILINNVGILIPEACPDFVENIGSPNGGLLTDQVLVNTLSMAQVTRMVLSRSLLKRGSPGLILNVSSAIGELDGPYFGAYSATKAFADKFSSDVRREVERRGISVVVDAPFAIKTNMTRPLSERQSSNFLVDMLVDTADNHARRVIRFCCGTFSGKPLGHITHGSVGHYIQFHLGRIAVSVCPDTLANMLLHILCIGFLQKVFIGGTPSLQKKVT